jgi:deoxyinosine 3'endonuclease (endonuclease V)
LHKIEVRAVSDTMTYGGQAIDLVGDSGRIWGAIFKPKDYTKQPLFVSIGHLVSLATSLDVVRMCTVYKIPEPIRQADLRSRAYIRQKPTASS